MDNTIRLRFAPSPTGALHIGGIRTALYNYLLAKKYGGTFILRIEDTDQTRYVPGAEEYIMEALEWCGLTPTEGTKYGGEHGPYRQSERKHLYKQYADQMVASGNAYYAFDTQEELSEIRKALEAQKETFIYNAQTRDQMRNSLTVSEDEVQKILDSGAAYTIRLKMPDDEDVIIDDIVRGRVVFKTKELDDKVLLKADGMPTYHLANIVDDHLMEITHVIRGEEWLPSTAHHVLMYRFLGWDAPTYAHLPLILKPSGNGKLSKRDGRKFGFPVFPLSWKGATEEDSFEGFREAGYDSKALINFLAFLGWNPGTEQEIFSMDELIEAFDINRITKSGARFDLDKLKWFNQQYLHQTPLEELVEKVKPILVEKGYSPNDAFLEKFCSLYKERVSFLPDFWTQGYYFFEEVTVFDEKTIRKKWKLENRTKFETLLEVVQNVVPFSAALLEEKIKAFIADEELSFGAVLPIIRIAVSGTTKGPSVFDMLELLGKEKVVERLSRGYDLFDQLKA